MHQDCLHINSACKGSANRSEPLQMHVVCALSGTPCMSVMSRIHMMSETRSPKPETGMLMPTVYSDRLTKNENAVEASHVTTQGNFQPSNNAQFVCPTTGQELNGRFRFSVLRNTGHVISERALKQVSHWHHLYYLQRCLETYGGQHLQRYVFITICIM